MCEKVNAIYFDGIERPEVVTVLSGSDSVKREIYRTVRQSGHCMIPEAQPLWLVDLAKINIEPSDFIKQQIKLSELAEKTIYERFGSDNFLKKQNLPFPFPFPLNMKKNERLGIRQKRNGENVYVVEDMNGSFKRFYNE